jgi:uncharacterized RDD family membrane protein YckC
VPGAAAQPTQQPAQLQVPQQSAPPGYYSPQAQPPYGQQQPYGQPQQYPQQPAYGGYPQSPQPGYGGYPQAPQRGVLADGARVAGWWWRVLARWLDGLVITLPTLIVSASLIRDVYDTFKDYVNQVDAANAAGTAVPSFESGSLTRDFVLIGVIYGVVAIVYEGLMLKFCSATLGKLICGLRVRLWQVRGPLQWGTVLKRVLGYQVLSAIPNVGGLYVLVDCLWPLWDGNRQALHDKLADTAVVKKHDAELAPQPYGG